MLIQKTFEKPGGVGGGGGGTEDTLGYSPVKGEFELLEVLPFKIM